MADRDVISDQLWAVIEPLLPKARGRSRPWLDHRLVVEGVAWRFRTERRPDLQGSPGDRRACTALDHGPDRQRQRHHHDDQTLERIRGTPTAAGAHAPARVLADKGHPSRANRAYLARRGIKATIPDREDQKANRASCGRKGGRPPVFDAGLHKETRRRRTRVQPAQDLARHRRAQRQDRPQLPGRHHPRRRSHLATHDSINTSSGLFHEWRSQMLIAAIWMVCFVAHGELS